MVVHAQQRPRRRPHAGLHRRSRPAAAPGARRPRPRAASRTRSPAASSRARPRASTSTSARRREQRRQPGAAGAGRATGPDVDDGHRGVRGQARWRAPSTSRSSRTSPSTTRRVTARPRRAPEVARSAAGPQVDGGGPAAWRSTAAHSACTATRCASWIGRHRARRRWRPPGRPGATTGSAPDPSSPRPADPARCARARPPRSRLGLRPLVVSSSSDVAGAAVRLDLAGEDLVAAP